MQKDKIRILLTKSETDAHDRGIVSVAGALRDAGFEVIFTRFLFPEEIVKSALEEDVDAIGIGTSIGGHNKVAISVMKRIKEMNMDRMTVIMGGVIPDRDVPELQRMGVAKVFGPGTPIYEIANFLTEQVKR